MKLSNATRHFTRFTQMFTQSLNKRLLLLGMALIVAACGNDNRDQKIILGFGPSTYAEQFETGIRPILERQGFEVEVKILTQNMQINPALKEGAIDVAGHQSVAYMLQMNHELNMQMAKLADTASAPQSLRSKRHQSLDVVKPGMTVAIPNDPVNAERAARILEAIGWVKVTSDDIARFSERDIQSLNGIKVLTLDPAQGLRVLDDVDFAVINGNYIASAGQKISDALVVEKTPEEHVVIISIREADLDKPWAIALKDAYESKEFAEHIQSNPMFDGFILPKAWAQYDD